MQRCRCMAGLICLLSGCSLGDTRERPLSRQRNDLLGGHALSFARITSELTECASHSTLGNQKHSSLRRILQKTTSDECVTRITSAAMVSGCLKKLEA